ncbi:MAG: NAD(P)/FAD-dependent oxidoreductase [Candidatus Riflebacteria bacterium]|nr:NAD(P)/FAD-dependent oxidoreductase [Candidatus Riflebacteria bacterium]
MDKIDIAIVGAGVIGLAVAWELSRNKRFSIIVIEKNLSFGKETSSHNSEVIHAGIYYPFDSLKRKLCLEGSSLLYKFLRDNKVPFKKIGKLIVASEEKEIPDLLTLKARAEQNEVPELKIVEKNELKKIEPHVNAKLGLFSGNTGILDTHTLMKRLFYLSKDAGVIFSFNTKIDFIEPSKCGFIIGSQKDDYRFLAKSIINCSGLGSEEIIKKVNPESNLRLKLCKGNYFSYLGKSPINHLVYPLPDKKIGYLGVHATLDMGNRLKFGPDAEFVDTIDLSVDEKKKSLFFDSASRMINNLDRNFFQPEMAGIRPKVVGNGFQDFVIQHQRLSSPGFINLFGIESPGLTSCLAIAKLVKKMVDEEVM